MLGNAAAATTTTASSPVSPPPNSLIISSSSSQSTTLETQPSSITLPASSPPPSESTPISSQSKDELSKAEWIGIGVAVLSLLAAVTGVGFAYWQMRQTKARKAAAENEAASGYAPVGVRYSRRGHFN